MCNSVSVVFENLFADLAWMGFCHGKGREDERAQFTFGHRGSPAASSFLFAASKANKNKPKRVENQALFSPNTMHTRGVT